nr:endolytic transglycosylase MltG [Bacteroidota bacterium]
LSIAAIITGFLIWRVVYKKNITTQSGEVAWLYIPTRSGFDQLVTNIKSSGLLKNTNTFEWLARQKNLPNHIYPGRYEIAPGLCNNELIDMLRSGSQKPLMLVFNNIRTSEQLAGVVAQQIEADSISIVNLLNDTSFLERYGFTPETVKTLFIPNSYEFFWNAKAEDFFGRMVKEYNRFWTDDRKAKAEKRKLDPVEVSILASIVDKETIMNDEKPRIAGVYLNRLRDKWKLQADPTLVYASGDFGLRRVLNQHKTIESPYNTYKYYGLPPGPICIPSIAGIDAVLDAENHSYFFFVAKGDGSGYHQFSKSLKQHNLNVKSYRDSLKNREN